MPLDEAKFQKLTRMLADVDDGTATMDPEVEQRARAAVSEYAAAAEPNAGGLDTSVGPDGVQPPAALARFMSDPAPRVEPSEYRSRFPANQTLSRFAEKTFGIPPEGMSQQQYRAELAQGDPLEQQAARDMAQGDVDAGRALNAFDGMAFMMGVPLARMALSGMGMPEAGANLERLQRLDPHPVMSSLAGGILTGGAVAKLLGLLSSTGSAAASVGLPEVAKAGGIGAGISGLTHYGSGLADFWADAAEGSPETLDQRLATLKDSLLGSMAVGGGLGIAGATFGALASANRNRRTPQGIATRLNEDLGGTANRPSPAAAAVIDDLGGPGWGQPGLSALDRAVEGARGPIARAQADAEASRVRTVENFKADYGATPQGQQRQVPHSTVRGLVEDLEGRVYDPAEGGGALGGVNNAPMQDLVRQHSTFSVVDGPTAKRMLQQDPKLIQIPLAKAQQLGLVRQGDNVRTPAARPPSVDMATDPGLPPMVQERMKWLGEELIQLNRRMEIEQLKNPSPVAEELVLGPIRQKMAQVQEELAALQAGSPPAGTPRYGTIPDAPMATQPSAPDRASMWAFDPKSSTVPKLEPTVVIHPKGVTAGELETIREAADRAAQLDRRQAGDVERWRVRRAADIRRDRLGYGSNEHTSWVDPVKIEVGGKVEMLPQGSYAAAMHRMGENLAEIQDRGVKLGMRPGADPASVETLKAVGNEISGSYSGRSGRIDVEDAINRTIGFAPELQPLMDTVRGVNTFQAMQGAQLTPGQVIAPFSTAPRLDAMRRFLDPVWRLGQDALSVGAVTQTPDMDVRSEAKKTYDGLKMLRSQLTGGSP